MRLLLVVILIFFTKPMLAQRHCYTSVSENEHPLNQKAISQTKILNDNIQGIEASGGTFKNNFVPSQLIRIPVVVHILYNNPTQNVSDAQVKSQIDALNRDFRRRNSDTVNIPSRFKQYAADVEIEFALAVVSPGGIRTNGIVRKQTNIKEWGIDDKIKFSGQGGDDAWDSRYYLNIWVGNIKKTLGYSSASNGPAEKDGIVISNSVFGTIGKTGSFNLGRTLVHETGHWLGLKHIWGDGPCGDDEVDDTPKQAGFTSGCPNEFRSTCGGSEPGDMYMNYMDFTDDACMNMFTYGQKLRMREHFRENGLRYLLLKSKGLDSTFIAEPPIAQIPDSIGQIGEPGNDDFSMKSLLFPNPAENRITLSLESKAWNGKEFYILDASGVKLQRGRVTSQSQTIQINGLKQGLYFIVLENGSARMILKFIKSGT